MENPLFLDHSEGRQYTPYCRLLTGFAAPLQSFYAKTAFMIEEVNKEEVGSGTLTRESLESKPQEAQERLELYQTSYFRMERTQAEMKARVAQGYYVRD